MHRAEDRCELFCSEMTLVGHHACSCECGSGPRDVVDWQPSLDSATFFFGARGQGKLAPLEGPSSSCRDVVVALVCGEHWASGWFLVDEARVGHAWGGHVGALLINMSVDHVRGDSVWVRGLLPARM